MPDVMSLYGPDYALRMGKDGGHDVTAAGAAGVSMSHDDAAAADWIRQQEQEIAAM